MAKERLTPHYFVYYREGQVLCPVSALPSNRPDKQKSRECTEVASKHNVFPRDPERSEVSSRLCGEQCDPSTPGCKRDDLQLLPSSTTKKVCPLLLPVPRQSLT